MSAFTTRLAARVAEYVQLRRSLGYSFADQATTLAAFARFAAQQDAPGPLTGDLAVAFVLAQDVTPNVRARRYGCAGSRSSREIVPDSSRGCSVG